MSKITKVLSLLGKLDEASAKEAGKKVSKAKKEKIDSERVLEALNEKIADNPQYLDTLEDDEYFDLMEALPAKQRADVMGDDYGMEMIESQSEMMTSMKPKEAAENLSLFTGAEEVSSYLGQLDAKGLKEFKAAVSTEDADLYQTALDKLESLGPRAAKMKGGKMKNNPFKVKYNAGGSTKKQSSISASDHIANDWRMVDSNQLDSEEALDRSLSQLSKAKSSEELMDLKLQLAKSWEKVTDQELPEEFYNADFKNKKTLKKLDESVLKRMKERKNMGGKIKTKYAEGGSILTPPEREEYSAGGKVFSLIAKALGKTTKPGKKPTRAKIQKAVDDVKKENPNLEKEIANDIQEVKDLRYVENYSVGGGGPRDIDSMFTSLLRGDTESIAMTSVPMKATKTYKKGQMKAGIAGAIAAFGGKEAYDKLTEPKQSEFEKAFSKAHNEGKETFTFEGKEFSTEVRKGKMSGGMLQYNEGSLLVAPEMGLEDEMPVDTYDNIPEDEQAAVESSQLPDNEMEEDYTEYVLEQSLDMEDQEYLMDVLEGDERLSSIFDKVMDVAGEFAGEGAVDGPGDGTSDSIPARLSDGEFVFTKKATDQLGADQLQTMMDDAERAYDGGYMKKAFGGMVDDTPEMEESKEDEEINSMMIASNQMPSVRPR
jgi:hypothetical protein